MKRLLLLLFIALACIYTVESTDIIGLNAYKPRLEAAFVANEYVLSWPRLPYLGYYEIEILKAPPADDRFTVPSSQRILRYRTFENKFTVERSFPFRTYWRVSARGLFRHPLGSYSDTLDMAAVMGQPAVDFSLVKPVPTTRYPVTAPASKKPMLTWTVVPGAVYYEIEFLTQPPENPGGTEPSAHRYTYSREVFNHGYNADLSGYPGDRLWWRVRALTYDGAPLGIFSDASEINIDRNIKQPRKPLPATEFNKGDMPPPLYPVYNWIPILGAVNYEVEVLSAPPENPNGTEPSQYRIWSKEATGFACYDEEPRGLPGTYYWRVRGLDAAGRPVGVYSDVGSFTVDLKRGSYAATFGDSITHGGGAVSYSPGDWEYSFQTYLDFPVVNLGKSGDTSDTMVARFERDVMPFRPRYLLILGGTNSLRGGTPAEQVIEDLAKIRNRCLARGIRPIFLTLPPINPEAIKKVFSEDTAPNWREEFDKVNDFIRQQRYYIDLDPYMSDAARELPDYYAIDGLHPDIAGKKVMAQIINASWPSVTR
jgi:lysophospholipase L1-like esterase